jgi:hypothetical protein
MRSARLRFPSYINLLVKRATFLLLYFASGISGRFTTLLRLGKVCLLLDINTRKGVEFDCSQVAYLMSQGTTPAISTDAYTQVPFRFCLENT